MSGGFKPSEGDWPCPDPSCGNVNFARRTSCNRCHADKPLDKKLAKGGIKIGSNAAEKSKGLFSADDWQCSKCGNVNWARRSTCNVCNGPQFTVEEERTGLGGGFNERGTVEYKDRQESDEEFDDRGRKKKKGPRNIPLRPSLPSMVVEDTPDEEEEEEDDDDDDGGDLSKYDLWGDVDEKKDDSKDEKNGKNDEKEGRDTHKRKKSRSRSRGRRSRSKDDKKRSRRSRSSSSSSSSSSSRSRSRSGKKSRGRNGGKSRRRSSSSSSSSRSRSRSKRDKKSFKKKSTRSRSSSKKGGGGRRRETSSSSSRSRSHSRRSRKSHSKSVSRR